MSKDSHFYYDKLTDKEKHAVDTAYGVYHHTMGVYGVVVAGDDRAEEVIDALAKHVIASRDLSF
jgi:hypothetical protein